MVGLLVGGVIAWSAFGLLKSALHLSLDGVPQSIDRNAIDQWLRALPGVADTHDLHIWAMSTTATALTVHLVMPEGRTSDEFLQKIAGELEHRFGIGHATLQIERGNGDACRLAPVEVV